MATKKKTKKEELIDSVGYVKAFSKEYGFDPETGASAEAPALNEYSIHICKNDESILIFIPKTAPHVNYYLDEGYAKISWDIE